MVLEKETALFKDSAIANDINGAQDTADEKSAVFYQPTAPPVAGRKLNDVWFDTDDDNTMYKFDGDGWSLQQFGKDAIVAGSITTAVLDTQDLYTNFLVTNILNAAHAVISDLSAITANIGEITAGVLKSSECLEGSGIYSTAGMIIDLTAGTIKTPKFAVTSSGVLYATDAILSGTITATAGEIGGFAIDSTSIHTKGAAITSNASGSVGLSSSTFTRTIGGTSRSGLKFAIGGNFGVTESGILYAQNAVISGTITMGGANNTNGSITIYNASGGQIGTWNKDGITATAGTIGGWQIGSSYLNKTYTAGGSSYEIRLQTYTSTLGALYDVFYVNKGSSRVASIGSNGDITGNVFTGSTYYNIWGNSVYELLHEKNAYFTPSLTSGTRIGTLTFGGTTTNLYCSSSTSDARLKDKIKDSEIDGLSMVNAISIRSFDWKDDHTIKHYPIGMIADELEQLDPRFVSGGGYYDDGEPNYKTIDTLYLCGYLVKALQELSSKIKMEESK